MNPFVRFILILLIAGSVIAFSIVLLADVRGARHQNADMLREKELFSQVIQNFSGVQRHGVIGVEWQKTANQQAMQTSLLVRIYTLNADGKEIPLPVERLIIPSDRICVEGLKLAFDQSFPEEYKDLRGATLLYFHFIHADGGPRKDGLTLFQAYHVPRVTKMHEDRTTQFELQLWQYLGELIDNPHEGRHGLDVTPDPATWPPEKDPASLGPPPPLPQKMTEPERSFIAAKKVTNDSLYSIYVGTDGTVILDNSDLALLNDMRDEAKRLDKEAATGKSANPDNN